MFEVASTTGSEITETITQQFADPGFLSVLVFAGGIFLAIWIMQQLVGWIYREKDEK